MVGAANANACACACACTGAGVDARACACADGVERVVVGGAAGSGSWSLLVGDISAICPDILRN